MSKRDKGRRTSTRNTNKTKTLKIPLFEQQKQMKLRKNKIKITKIYRNWDGGNQGLT